jgi:hypothetical protein
LIEFAYGQTRFADYCPQRSLRDWFVIRHYKTPEWRLGTTQHNVAPALMILFVANLAESLHNFASRDLWKHAHN